MEPWLTPEALVSSPAAGHLWLLLTSAMAKKSALPRDLPLLSAKVIKSLGVGVGVLELSSLKDLVCINLRLDQII